MKIGDRVEIVHSNKFMTPEMESYCGKYATIVNIFRDNCNYTYYLLDIDDQVYTWTEETLKVVNNMRKVGDKVRTKSLDWYNKNKNANGYIHLKNENFVRGMVPYLGTVATITAINRKGNYIIDICPDIYAWTDEMFEDLETFQIPEGYCIDMIDGDTIFIKKKTLPKTWKECIESLKSACYLNDYSDIHTVDIRNIKESDHNLIPEGLGKPMLAFMQLLVCREVYRQGWKPDWKESKYCIINTCDGIRTYTSTGISFVLSFQSAEVRDEFFDNFRDLIEEAKELL